MRWDNNHGRVDEKLARKKKMDRFDLQWIEGQENRNIISSLIEQNMELAWKKYKREKLKE